MTAPGTTPPPAVQAGGGIPVAGCVKVAVRGKRKLRRAFGKLRVKGGACVTASSPLALKLKSRKTVRKVRFKLDGEKLRTVRRRGARVASTSLAPGRHKLVVRVVPRSGKPRTFKLRLRVVAG